MTQKWLKGEEKENALKQISEYNEKLSEIGKTISLRVNEANKKDAKFNGKIHSPIDNFDFKLFFNNCKKYGYF